MNYIKLSLPYLKNGGNCDSIGLRLVWALTLKGKDNYEKKVNRFIAVLSRLLSVWQLLVAAVMIITVTIVV